MFCKNCKAELNENTDFCSQCEIEINETPVHKVIVPKRKRIIISAIIILVVAISLVCIKTYDVNSSPEKVAAATIKSEYEVDIKTMMKCFPDFSIREIAVDEGLAENAHRSDVIKEVEADYRHKTPQKVEITSTELIGEYDISDYTIFRELYAYMTDKEYDLITRVAKVNVGFNLDDKENSIQITCIKMKNKWYLLDHFQFKK